MTSRFKPTLALLIAAVLFGGSQATASDDDDDEMYLRTVVADFDNVRFGLESAIENRGYVIDYRGAIGDMLDRTAEDVGEGPSPYLVADTWQFCSAVLSRRAMQADPANIAFCPYVLFAYETTAEPGTVVVGFRKHGSDDDDAGGSESRQALEAVDQELAAIVDEAIE